MICAKWISHSSFPRFLLGSVLLIFLVCCVVLCIFALLVYVLYIVCPMDCLFLIPFGFWWLSVVHLLTFLWCVVYFCFVCLRTVCCVPNGFSILDSHWFLMGSVLPILLAFFVVLCISAFSVFVLYIAYPMDCPYLIPSISLGFLTLTVAHHFSFLCCAFLFSSYCVLCQMDYPFLIPSVFDGTIQLWEYFYFSGS